MRMAAAMLVSVSSCTVAPTRPIRSPRPFFTGRATTNTLLPVALDTSGSLTNSSAVPCTTALKYSRSTTFPLAPPGVMKSPAASA
ncbi:MAG: hypothetical protein BWY59_01350 [Verrucomicrobia bacterium ADurb.Bin345]|nr:MAG: hypothetical protein BWY59_01350 [Verrucomicrobia bacterium ADurb.Bin345]